MALEFSKFKGFFGSWAPRMEPFFQRGDMDRIYEVLKEKSGQGKKIAPQSHQVFRCFKETPLESLKVVFMGLSPYHTIQNGEMVANGLLMSTDAPNTPPSLQQFYDAMERDLYTLNLNMDKTNNLSYLAHQGVLLFNASLTCEIGKAGSHLKLWEPFTRYVLGELVPSNIPIVFLGQEAAKFKRSLAPMQWSFSISHPASAAYKGDQWNSEGIFRKINDLLGKGNEIEWAKLNESYSVDDLPF